MSMHKIKNHCIKSAICWIIALTLLLGVCLFIYVGVTTTKERYNLDYSYGFPKSASNISYYFSFLHNVYEYNISLDDLQSVAKDKGWTFSNIPSDNGVTIFCYSYTDKQKEEVMNDKENIFAPYYKRTVKNGLFYKTLGQRGGIVVVYDKDINRLYFYSARR
jgi:hypothetical protein